MAVASVLRLACGRRLAVVKLGDVRILVDLESSLGKSLYRYGAPLEAHDFADLVHRGDLVIDGGANVGVFALLAAQATGSTGSVVAVEAHSGTARMLERNRQLSRFEWMTVVDKALSDDEGQAWFVALEAGSGLSRLAREQGESSARQVATTTIDSIAASGGRPVTAIKLDVEDAEVKALRGGHKTLSEDRPLLVREVEPAHLVRQGSDVATLEALLNEHGYSEFWGVSKSDRIGLKALSDAPLHGVTNVFCRAPRSAGPTT